MIRGVSFDLWDTLVVDNSDEAKRQELGLRSKADERRHLAWQELLAGAPVELESVSLTMSAVDAAAGKVWGELNVTWSVRDRLELLLKGLGRTLPQEVFDALVDSYERMEVEIPPDPIPGVRETLAELANRYRLCVTSDAVFTPGRNLRQILAHHDLERYFQGFVFSDEVGRSKPDKSMFTAAAEVLGLSLPEIVHVGDRQRNDIAGPQALGMKAVLLTASRDVDQPHTTADAICQSHAELPAVIERLSHGDQGAEAGGSQ